MTSPRVTFQRFAGLIGKENDMVYPAKVIELKRLSPHVSIDMKRSISPTAPRPRV